MQHALYYLSYLKVPFSAEIFIHYRLTLLLFLAVVILSYIIDFYLSQSFFGQKYRYFLAPGVIVHELSHGFACFFTGAKVTQMSMFEKDGGHVKHTKSKLPILGSVLISLAPLIVGIVLIYFISRYLSTTDLNLFKYGYSAKAIVAANISLIKSLSGFSIKNWILLYLTISVAVTMIPSSQDILNSFIPLIILIFAFLILSKYTHIFLPMGSLNLLLFTVINLLILAAILSIIIFALTNIFRR
jgi:hypothetical protein